MCKEKPTSLGLLKNARPACWMVDSLIAAGMQLPGLPLFWAAAFPGGHKQADHIIA
jgi:hypothetical protein